VLLFAVQSLLGSVVAEASARQVYSIQTGAYKSTEEAETVREQIARTCSPVFVEEVVDGSGHAFKVRVGKFRYYAQAWAYKSKLSGTVPPDCFIVIRADDGKEPELPVLPVELPFDLTGLDAPEPGNASEFWAAGGFGDGGGAVQPPASPVPPSPQTRDELLAAGMSAPRNASTGVPALEQFLQRYPQDPKANRARLVLARSIGRGSNFNRAETLLAQTKASGNTAERVMANFLTGHVKYNRKSLGESFGAFRAVASDRAAPPSLRREAMQRAAAVAHAARDYPAAWLAFEQIERTATDAKVATEARMQLAGLAYELAGRGKGSWEEVRSLCAEARDAQDVPRNVKATAALMHLESLYEAGKLDEALSEVQDYCITYADVPREYHLARVWQGIILYKLGYRNQAQVVLESVMASDIAVDQKFALMDPQARAAVWLAWFARDAGNTSEQDRWLDRLFKDYPNTEDAQKARALFGKK
jgi:hypothetical protein